MKKQRRRQLVSAALTGLCLVQAPVLSGCSEKTQSSQEETDSQVSTEAGAAETAEDKDRYLYYLKDNAFTGQTLRIRRKRIRSCWWNR